MDFFPPQGTWLRRTGDRIELVPAGSVEEQMAVALQNGGGLVVLGAFGAGKTETSRRVGARLGVPVIPLRVLARSGDLEQTLERLLDGAEAAILDGLDEIGRPDHRDASAFFERVTRQVRRWVVTSRPGHVRTDTSDPDPRQVDCFHLPLLEILPYPAPPGAPPCCGDHPVLAALYREGARGETPGALLESFLLPLGNMGALETLAWRSFIDPGASPESASFAEAEIRGLPPRLFVEDLDGRWRFGHRSLYDGLVARVLSRRLAAAQGGPPDELTGLHLSGAMRAFLVGAFPGWKHDTTWTYVPHGNFVSGGARSADERPLMIRHLPQPALLARLPVTNAAFQDFLRAEGARPPAVGFLAHWRGGQQGACPDALLDHPVQNLRPEDAAAYAAWAGCSLPDADTWEKAARGWDGRNFPWGDTFSSALANTAESGRYQTCPADAHPQGSGLFGIVGDVFEVTASPWRGRLDRGSVVMGGSYAHPPLRASLRLSHTLSGHLRLGLRCARDPSDGPVIFRASEAKERVQDD